MIIFGATNRVTFIHRVDPRARVVCAMAFAVTVCFFSRVQPLCVGLAGSVALAGFARIGNRRTLKRIGALNLFLLMLLALLPLSGTGDVALRFGPLCWHRDGIRLATIIALRANAILLTCLSLLGTIEPTQLGAALNRLGVSNKLTHIFLFMIRYIEVLHEEYHRLRDAMRLRGFRPRCDRHTCRTFGYLVGMLLVRSFDRAERIVEAMKCRGFSGHFYVLTPFRVMRRDVASAILWGVYLAGLCWLEWT